MSNPFYNALGNGKNNPMAILSQLKQNPIAFLSKAGYKIPNNLSDPNAIIQHLMNSGQVTQAQYNRAQQMAQRFRP